MDRKQYLANLWAAFPDNIGNLERAEMVDYYDEMIKEYVADGYSEQEAVLMMETPEQILADSQYYQEKPKKKIGWGLILLLVLGFPLWGSLVFAALMMVLSAYLIIWTPMLVTGVMGVTLPFAGTVSVLFSFFALQDGLAVALGQSGLGLVMAGVGLICLLLTLQISRGIIKATRKLTVWCIRKMRGGVAGYAL